MEAQSKQSIDSTGFLKPPVHRFLLGLAGSDWFSPVRQHNRSVEQLEPVTPPVPGWTGQSGPVFKTMHAWFPASINK